MVTTIQLDEKVKLILDRMKKGKQTYEQVILDLINFMRHEKRRQEELMIEGCKEMAEENLKITKEFEVIEDLNNWEWNED